MTTPAIRGIRRNFPRAKISMLAKSWVAPLFTACPDVDEIILYDEIAGSCRRLAPLQIGRRLRPYRFDCAILLQNAFEAAVIALAAGIPIRIGYRRDGRGALLTHPIPLSNAMGQKHQTHYYLNILSSLGLKTFGTDLSLTLTDEAHLRADRLLRQCALTRDDILVGLNPGAAFGPAKQWPARRFAQLADRIQKTFSVRILIFGGPADRPLGEHLIHQMSGPAVNLAGMTRLDETAALISRCRLMITNDSGLMHVAAAVGAPVAAVFGSTDPAATGPLSPLARVVRHPLPCSPCCKPECPKGHLACMKNIDVETVFKAAEELLWTS